MLTATRTLSSIPRPGLIASARPQFAELDELAAKLSAVLVDLAARARHGKVEGLAMPLLAHARELCDSLDERIEHADSRVRPPLSARAALLRERLSAVETAFARLRLPA